MRPLCWESHCVTTRTTAAKETQIFHNTRHFSLLARYMCSEIITAQGKFMEKSVGKKTEKENKPFHGFRRVSSQKYFESYGLCICCILDLDSYFLVVKKIALTADVVNVFHSTGL